MLSARATRRALSHLLTSPAKVAHALDWQKASGSSILSMSISKKSIDLSISFHPEMQEKSQPVPPIPILTHVINDQRVIDPTVASELSDVLQEWKVCGVVVFWPVQKEGWPGASCGRVLFTLDQLIRSSTTESPGAGILDANRKVCLYNTFQLESYEDKWGRAKLYSHTSNKKIHYASLEQYQTPEVVAAEVWQNFCRVHWPEFQNFDVNLRKTNGVTRSRSLLPPMQEKRKRNAFRADTGWLCCDEGDFHTAQSAL